MGSQRSSSAYSAASSTTKTDRANVRFQLNQHNIAYGQSQRTVASVHPPKTCHPGGGWQIQHLCQVEAPGAGKGAGPLRVTRSLIQVGDERLLLSYWYQQRGCFMNNSYLVHWNPLVDFLLCDRTDGALVRLTAEVPPGEDVAHADQILTEFSHSIALSVYARLSGDGGI